MSESEAKRLAEELVSAWAYGTDIEDRIADWMLRDLREKAAVMFLRLKEEP